jgi:hypothetical protein
MAGGSKKPVNIFRLKNLPEPREVFNWRLWFAVVSFGLMGAARGVDEGLISGAFNSKDFQKTIHYSSYSLVEQTNIKANVSAMVQIGSVGGALLYAPMPFHDNDECSVQETNHLSPVPITAHS